MDNAKYIVVKMHVGVGFMEVPIVFPSFVQHRDIARQMGLSSGEVISAGFVEFFPSEEDHVVDVQTMGESVSLGVKTRSEDATLIRSTLRLNPWR